MEKKEADILVNEGLRFTVGKRNIHIKPLTYGAMAYANKHAVSLRMDLEEDNNSKLFMEIGKNIKPYMRFIAVCILGSKWKIKLFTGLLANWLMWRLKPKKAFEIGLAIVQMHDLANFISSIRLIGETTITKPKTETRVDTSKEVSKAHSEQ